MTRKIYPNHPKCVNHGCETFVKLQGLDKQGNPKYRPNARKFFKEVRAVSTTPKGRFNAHMIILRCF